MIFAEITYLYEKAAMTGVRVMVCGAMFSIASEIFKN